MFIIVFLLGRPGSGKSTAASLIRIDCTSIAAGHSHSDNDYEHLQEMFLREEAENTSLSERDFRRRGSERCNGFDVKNFSVLRTVLEEMRKEVEDIMRY